LSRPRRGTFKTARSGNVRPYSLSSSAASAQKWTVCDGIFSSEHQRDLARGPMGNRSTPLAGCSINVHCQPNRSCAHPGNTRERPRFAVEVRLVGHEEAVPVLAAGTTSIRRMAACESGRGPSRSDRRT
jgi:hypothetical protein